MHKRDPAPFRLAILVPGCAEAREASVAVSNRIGPLIEMLAELLGEVTILAYEPPPVPTNQEDRVDYLMRPRDAVINLISLGPKGTFRDYVSRRRRVAALAKAHGANWDVLFLPLVNRRVALVFDNAGCKRVVAQIGGHTPSVIRNGQWRGNVLRGIYSLLTAVVAERHYQRIAHRSLFFVNGEGLLPRYDSPDSPVQVLRSSARRADFRYDVADRFTTKEPNLLVLSRLTPPKGVFDALEAFALLRSGALPTARLHIIGDGDAEAELRARVDAHGLADAVEFHGWVPAGPDLFKRLQGMDAMLALSLAESLPKTVWECMAHSVLIVSTPVGSLPDVFTDGEDLLFVPIKDPAAAAAAVERLAKDPELRARLIARGQAEAASVTLDAVAAELLKRIVERWPELQT